MTTIEYLSMSKFQRALYKIGNFFVSIPKAIWRWIKKVGYFFKNLGPKLKVPFLVLYDALVYGDYKTRLTFIIFGYGRIVRKDKVRGILALLYEIVFIAFMVYMGGETLSNLGNLGTIASIQYINEFGLVGTSYYDNSFQILLYSIVTIILILIFVVLWYSNIKRSKELQDLESVGKYHSDGEFFHSLVDRNYHKTLLAFPTFGVVCFTIIPIIFMIIIGFTNYNSYHLSPAYLFDWVGLQNYENLFAGSDVGNTLFLTTFLRVLGWTLIWAFFATFVNYFLGMIVAILINTKGIKLKKLWRTVLVTTIAVPQFISLLLISRMLNTDVGYVNQFLQQIGLISSNIAWLEDPLIAKVMIIVVNTWIGIPYTMLICTGLLMNIPEDLYESAKIDGASPFRMYMKITLPYMLFVTTPYLISQFVGNINNFNVIYLLSGGNPSFTFDPTLTVPTSLNGVGRTDLLITWIYKLTVTNVFKDYGVASILGVMIFVVVAFFSLIFYGRSNSVKNEEDFQ